MPRSNWKGSISFGLVSIPIYLVNCEDPSHTISFKQINRKTGNRIKYKRVDAETDKEVPWEQIGKGYEYDKETILPVESGELEKVAGENAHIIAIEEFVDSKNVSFLNVDKSYFILPDKKNKKAYVILREALKASHKVGIAKVIITTKEYLAAVSFYGDALVLHLLHYFDEMRAAEDLDLPDAELKKYKISAKEIEIAKKLIQTMSGKWKPEKYKDEYKEAVEKWLHNKIKHKPLTKMAKRGLTKKSASKEVDLISLLKKSLADSKPKKKTGMKPAVASKSSSFKKPVRRGTRVH